jgi:hypothetical protein
LSMLKCTADYISFEFKIHLTPLKMVGHYKCVYSSLGCSQDLTILPKLPDSSCPSLTIVNYE